MCVVRQLAWGVRVIGRAFGCEGSRSLISQFLIEKDF